VQRLLERRGVAEQRLEWLERCRRERHAEQVVGDARASDGSPIQPCTGSSGTPAP
jgi:hypothetical protein